MNERGHCHVSSAGVMMSASIRVSTISKPASSSHCGSHSAMSGSPPLSRQLCSTRLRNRSCKGCGRHHPPRLVGDIFVEDRDAAGLERGGDVADGRGRDRGRTTGPSGTSWRRRQRRRTARRRPARGPRHWRGPCARSVSRKCGARSSAIDLAGGTHQLGEIGGREAGSGADVDHRLAGARFRAGRNASSTRPRHTRC